MNQRTLKDFFSLPVNADEAWQGGIVSLADMLGIPLEDDGEGLSIVIWRSTSTELAHAKPIAAAGERCLDEFVQVMLELYTTQDFHFRPAKIECNDRALADQLSELLQNSGTTVQFVPRMKQWNQVLQEFSEHLGLGGPPAPSLMDAGCTEPQIREFADAAAAFHRASLWDYLDDVDLIKIEKPKPLRNLRFAVVLGAGSQTFGLGFYDDPEEHYALMAERVDATELNLASLTFHSPAEVRSGDVALWSELDLPLESGEALPSLDFISPEETRRPTPRELELATVVLKALAATSEDDIDSGRWTKSVKLRGRQKQCVLSIPDLLDPPDRREWIRRGMTHEPRGHERHLKLVEEFIRAHGDEMTLEELNAAVNARFTGPMDDFEYPMDTPAERADALCQQAIDSFGRRRVQLAKQALAEDATHVEANVLIAETTRPPNLRIERFQRAKEVGKTQLGSMIEEEVGHFWDLSETRPFMRACHGLAAALRVAARSNEAIEQYQQMLHLNPNDNQGVRYEIIPLLLTQNREAEAIELLDRYQEETALWHYMMSIAEFRRGGRSPKAKKALRRAFRANEHVVPLMESEGPPMFPDIYASGSPEEAAVCIDELADAWDETEGYLYWMFQEYFKWDKERRNRIRDRKRQQKRKKSGGRGRRR